MRISLPALQEAARVTEFRAEIVEKVIYLLHVLEALQRHPFLAGRLVLKGGTALNLFYFNLPRLSVDIDLNYIGAIERETMLAERPQVEAALQAVCAREDLAVTRVPSDHAGGKWSLRYASALGQGGNLNIDLNFMFRIPLWSPVAMDSTPIGIHQAHAIPVLDIHELAAGKLAALLSRQQARDLFDAHQLLCQRELDATRLRIAFVVYGAMNRIDWRTVQIEQVGFRESEVADRLLPMLTHGMTVPPDEIPGWGDRIVSECRNALGKILPFTPAEREFLDRILDHGEIVPQLLTTNDQLAERIRHHPMLAWKAFNVRQHRQSAPS